MENVQWVEVDVENSGGSCNDGSQCGGMSRTVKELRRSVLIQEILRQVTKKERD